MNPNARAQDLIEVAESFADVLEQENELLKTHRTAEIADLRESKSTLARLYETRIKEAHAERDRLKEVEPALRAKLIETNERFEQAMRENLNAIRAAMELNDQLLQTVARAVHDQQAVARGYTATGQNARALPQEPLGHVPMSLDKEF